MAANIRLCRYGFPLLIGATYGRTLRPLLMHSFVIVWLAENGIRPLTPTLPFADLLPVHL